MRFWLSIHLNHQLNRTYTHSEINHYQFANNSPWHKNAFYRIKFPKNNYRPTLTSSAQTCSNWRCASSALCLHFKPRALVWRRPPSAHLWRQPSHWHWLVRLWLWHNCRSSHTRLAFSYWMIYWVRCDELSRTKFELLWIPGASQSTTGESPK